jgi:hypothetical protein
MGANTRFTQGPALLSPILSPRHSMGKSPCHKCASTEGRAHPPAPLPRTPRRVARRVDSTAVGSPEPRSGSGASLASELAPESQPVAGAACRDGSPGCSAAQQLCGAAGVATGPHSTSMFPSTSECQPPDQRPLRRLQRRQGRWRATLRRLQLPAARCRAGAPVAQAAMPSSGTSAPNLCSARAGWTAMVRSLQSMVCFICVRRLACDRNRTSHGIASSRSCCTRHMSSSPRLATHNHACDLQACPSISTTHLPL